MHGPQPIPSDQPGTGSPTHEQLRQRPLPPFPPDVDFFTCAIAGTWAAQGTPEQISKEDAQEFALFCLQHQYADALRWMVLRHDMATLRIARGNITNNDLLWLIDWADSLPCPINLDLRGNRIDVSADDVALAIARRGKLNGLDVRANRAPALPMSGFFTSLRSNTGLTILSMDLLEKDVEALHQYLRENRSLQALCLRRPANEPANTRLNPARALLTNNTLSRIELDGWHIGRDLAKSLFTPHQTLTSICFSRCVFEDRGFGMTAAPYTVSVLEFHGCYLTQALQSDCVSWLLYNRSLTRLSFGKQRLDKEVLLQMKEVLTENETLLDFSHNIETGDAHLDPEEDARSEVAKAIEQRLKENGQIFRACQHSLLENPASCLPATVHAQAGNTARMMGNDLGKLALPPFPERIHFPERNHSPNVMTTKAGSPNGRAAASLRKSGRKISRNSPLSA